MILSINKQRSRSGKKTNSLPHHTPEGYQEYLAREEEEEKIDEAIALSEFKPVVSSSS